VGDLGRMPNLKKYKETKLVRPELNVFLAVGAFNPFTRKKKKNNSKQPKEEKKIDGYERKPTDFHSDMEKKVDALIANVGKETKSEEPKKDILNSKIDDNEHINDKDILDQTSGEHNVAPKHSIISFTHHIKIRSKEEREKLKGAKEKSNPHDTTLLSENLKFKVEKKETGTDNVFTKTERGLEETKIENERKELVEHNSNKLRKLELKKAKKEARDKENELEIKRLEEEKRRKLELKKARRMEKAKGKNLVDSNQQNTPRDENLEQEWKKNKEHNEKNNSQTPEMDTLIVGKKEMEKEDSILDENIKKVLLMTDNLLGNLPEEVIDEFVKSKDFALYEKVISKYKIK
jgi:hypothetical protein